MFALVLSVMGGSAVAGGVDPDTLPLVAHYTDRLIVKLTPSSAKGPSVSAVDGAQMATTLSATTGR